ncbi:MAG TPA: hypothetical protein VF338_09105, partial [Leptolinea sp.]
MPLNTTIIKAICFDVDGTLSDTDDLYVQKLLPFVKPFRWITPQKEASFLARRLIMNLETPGNNLYYLLDRVGLDAFAGKVYNVINRAVLHPQSKKYLMVPGTNEVLEALGRRFPMA